jgi:hypothetical protein
MLPSTALDLGASLAVLSLLLPACGGVVDTGRGEAGSHDGASGDAASHDSSPGDVGTSDNSNNPETAPVDTGLPESSSNDGATGCNGIGAACSSTTPCPGGLSCYAGGGSGYCGPPTQCEGFVGKTCPSGLVCIVPTLCADCFGTCVSPAQVACICPSDHASAVCPDAG